LTLQEFINHDRVCLSNDCNLRFHDSQIKENQRSEINFLLALIGLCWFNNRVLGAGGGF
jgi:hypothetical protein